MEHVNKLTQVEKSFPALPQEICLVTVTKRISIDIYTWTSWKAQYTSFFSGLLEFIKSDLEDP